MRQWRCTDHTALRLHLGLLARQADRDQFECDHPAGGAGQAATRRRAADPAEPRSLSAAAASAAAAEAAVRKLLLALLAFASLAAPALAQDPAAILNARRAGLIGERYDGYLGVVNANLTASLRRQVGAINIRRRALY